MTSSENKKQNRFKNSISLKLIIVILLCCFLLIPSVMVRKLINEREYRKDGTTREITSKWGSDQVITGPILLVPYNKKIVYQNETCGINTRYFQILPSNLTINGTLDTDMRHRGIYDVLIYSGKFKIEGDFEPRDLQDFPDVYERIIWEEAKIVLGISDTKGISKIISLNWNEQTKNFSPGSSHCNIVTSGVNSPIKINTRETNSFKIDLDLNGSSSVYFTPVGKETTVHLEADWNTPSFDGWYITTKNEISDTGFTALWNTNEMTRTYPQIIINDNGSDYIDLQSFGVNLLMPVDTYQKSERSVKYSFLFIALTFLIIFFAEITGKKRIHPVQYLIVGLALVIFYSLLIALAEHIPFNYAYLIASLVVISMILAFAQSLFKRWKNTFIIGTALLLLYIYLFTILQIADYALLLGNIGLVIILGLVMIYSKKVDWYGSQNPAKRDAD